MADNIFDQFDQPAQPATLRGQAAGPASNVFDQFDAPKVPAENIGTAGHLARGFYDEQMAAVQGVSPNATAPWFPDKPANKPQRLGDLVQEDWGAGYKGPNGEMLRVNPKTDFIAHDPETGRLAAYARNEQTDTGKLAALGHLVLPGMATGPVTGIQRATGAAAAAQPALRAEIASQRAAEGARDVAAFDQLDVRKPAIAFMQGPMASVGKQLSETPWVGAPLKNALDESLQGVARASEDVAGKFGAANTAETGGAAIKAGLERFKDARPADVVERAAQGYTPAQRSEIIAAPARDTSLKTKQAALYERAWSLIPEEMKQGRAVENLPRVLGDVPQARSVLQEVQSRNLRMINASAENSKQAAKPIASSGLLGKMVDAITTKEWRASLQTMRELRSEFRRLASGMADTERNTMKLSDIERVQSALTRDMTALLQRNADKYREIATNAGWAGDPKASSMIQTARNAERAIIEFQRADKFTRLSAQRMDYIERMFNAPSSEALYRGVVNAALSKGRGDLQKLTIMRRTLRGEEMNDVAAAVIRQLGEPVGSARGSVQEAGFSPASFMTRWANMTPEARSIIFGHEHSKALGDLVSVVNRLANVEALANTSRSATNALNFTGAVGAVTSLATGKILPAAALAGSGFGMAVLLSRPAYVNWVTKYAQIRAAMLRAPLNVSSSRMVTLINQLEQLAKKDPQLLPVYRAIAQENGVGERDGNDKPVGQQPRVH